MRLYKETFRLFRKDKFLWAVLLAYNVLSMANIGYWAKVDLGIGSMLEHTRMILMLCPQFLLLYLILSYEFCSRQHRANLAETLVATGGGRANQPAIVQLAVLTTVLFVNFLAVTGLNLFLTSLSFTASRTVDAGHIGAVYIVKCMFVNVFLISLIGVLLGLVLSKIQKRVVGYGVIMGVALVVSYLLEEISMIVMVLTDYAVNLSDLLDLFQIMPTGLNYQINSAFGFPIMTYRVCLILFWCLVMILILLVRDSKNKRSIKTLIGLACCIAALIGYALPSSRVDMSLSSSGSVMADQHYYEVGQYRIGEREGGFEVERYRMDLDVHRLLKAKVTMDVSRCRKEYRFTLSHSYEVERVTDAQGKEMAFDRDGDALLVDNRRANTKRITVEYHGANEAYYSNSQGMNLHGSFPYYPISGYRQITEDGLLMNPLFLEQDAWFEIRVHTPKQVYSNLRQQEDGSWTGMSNGPTLLSGLYTSTVKNGVEIVYAPLSGWNADALDAVTKAVRKAGYRDCKVFITPIMNREDSAVSEEQILTRNYFEDVSELEV